MSLKKLPAKAVKENTAALEDLYLNSKLDMSYLDSSYSPREGQLVDVAIATLAQYGNTVILAEILEAEEISHDYNWDALQIRVLTEIYALWVDKKAIISREDNLLNEPDTANPHWKALFNHELSKLVATKGKLMAHYRSHYGWEDYMRHGEKLPNIVAMFNMKEDYWGEFTGTFVTEEDSRSGFTCHVMYADGSFRDLRYEGSIGEIMKELG